MYNYDEIIPFLATLEMPSVWLERAVVAAYRKSDILLWSALEHGLNLAHNGEVLNMLEKFEK